MTMKMYPEDQPSLTSYCDYRNNAHAAPTKVIGGAARHLLGMFGRQHPGHTVELRVPPYGVVQCIAGSAHRRGTPPHTVEIEPEAWIELALGFATWIELENQGKIIASGHRSNLSEFFPLIQMAGH